MCNSNPDSFSLDNEKMPADTMGQSATGSDCLAVGTGTDTTTTGDYIIIEGKGKGIRFNKFSVLKPISQLLEDLVADLVFQSIVVKN